MYASWVTHIDLIWGFNVALTLFRSHSDENKVHQGGEQGSSSHTLKDIGISNT